MTWFEFWEYISEDPEIYRDFDKLTDTYYKLVKDRQGFGNYLATKWESVYEL